MSMSSSSSSNKSIATWMIRDRDAALVYSGGFESASADLDNATVVIQKDGDTVERLVEISSKYDNCICCLRFGDDTVWYGKVSELTALPPIPLRFIRDRVTLAVCHCFDEPPVFLGHYRSFFRDEQKRLDELYHSSGVQFAKWGEFKDPSSRCCGCSIV